MQRETTIVSTPDGELEIGCPGNGFDITVDGEAALLTWARLRPGSTIELRLPVTRAVGYWEPRSDQSTSFPVPWDPPRDVRTMKGAPLGALYDDADRNVVAFAVCVCVTSCLIRSRIEIPSTWICEIEVASTDHLCDEEHAFSLRIDSRLTHFANALRDQTGWWESQLGPSAQLPVPPRARRPALSTWYSMQRAVTAAGVEQLVRAAEDLECGVIIVDDGWQSGSEEPSYSGLGEWTSDPAKFPAPAEHARRVRERGLDYMLWCAPGVVGSAAVESLGLARMLLADRPRMKAAVIDPRDPRARVIVAERCTRLTREFDLDGLKIDFVDAFYEAVEPTASPQADCDDVGVGVERLLAQVSADLLSRRGDEALVEFRQDYFGPRMWRYANIFRANDCPDDLTANRVRTIDLRLTCPSRAIHSDMVSWDASASVARASLTLINVLFAVPQISVDLATLPDEHRSMLRYWLGVQDRFGGALQRGRLIPSRPDLRYPIVTAEDSDARVIALYGTNAVHIDAFAPECIVIANATGSDEVLVATEGASYRGWIHDPTGRRIGSVELRSHNPIVLSIPSGGSCELERIG